MKSLECFNKESIILLLKRNLLNSLVKQELFHSLISEVKIEEEQTKELLKQFKKINNISSEDDFQDFLSKQNVNINDLIYKLSEPLKLIKYAKENFSHKVEQRFLKNKNQLDIVVYSLIRTKDHIKAREIYLQILEKEEEFGVLAMKYSEGKEKLMRGIVGPCPLDQAHPQLVEVLKSMEPGKVHKPFPLDEFTIIVRLESFIEARLTEEMREQLVREIFDDWLNVKTKEETKILLNKVK